VTGPDDLLLLLVQHWARDESVFPTEDDRLDLPTIMLFQSYTGCRLVELVHAPRGRGLGDPLDEKDTPETDFHRETQEIEYDDESDDGNDINDSGFCTDDDDSDVSGNAMDQEDDGLVDVNIDVDHNDCSGYRSDGTDDTATEDTGGCYTTEVNGLEEPVRRSAGKHKTQELDEFGEPVREYKALCYEDICLWVVKNPKRGDRDLLAMEVNLRHHKGADNKPKPCVTLLHMLSPS
jgi:hypothetical protein